MGFTVLFFERFRQTSHSVNFSCKDVLGLNLSLTIQNSKILSLEEENASPAILQSLEFTICQSNFTCTDLFIQISWYNKLNLIGIV